MPAETSFGARLRALRQKKGISQAALAGEELSTGYLSRLESGTRQPSERVLTYLAGRLGVDRSEFFSGAGVSPLSQAVSIAASTDGDDAVEGIVAALASPQDGDPVLRWQALWLVAQSHRRHGRHAEERSCLEEAGGIADSLELPALQCRSKAALARCLRSLGDVPAALELALAAFETARKAEDAGTDAARALLTLVAVEAEAGRLADAGAHADELVGLVPASSGALRAEALWTAATLRSRQGDADTARTLLQEAMESLDSRVDPLLWARLRLAAASLYLQARPALTDVARTRLDEADRALSLVGTPAQQQEVLMLKASLAFEESRFTDARAVLDELDFTRLALSYRDTVRLRLLEGLLLIEEGRQEQGLAQIKELGEEAHRDGSLDLAAEVWRVLAGALEKQR